MLTGLVSFYMWLGFKSGPSGLEHALRGLAATFGKDSKESDEKDRTESEAVKSANGNSAKTTEWRG